MYVQFVYQMDSLQFIDAYCMVWNKWREERWSTSVDVLEWIAV
jgi:hypothetical protein